MCGLTLVLCQTDASSSFLSLYQRRCDVGRHFRLSGGGLLLHRHAFFGLYSFKHMTEKFVCVVKCHKE